MSKKFNEKALLSSGAVLVATYGSLRRNMENFGVNARAGGDFLVSGKSVKNIPLYRYGAGHFPSISLAESDVTEDTPQVIVDVFVTTEAGLQGAYDCLEGYNSRNPEHSFYNRSEEEFIVSEDFTIDGEEVKAGTTITAWVYHIDSPQEVQVMDGDWCVHKRGDDYYSSL